MIAWTSPLPTVRSIPWRISCSGSASGRDAEAADDELLGRWRTGRSRGGHGSLVGGSGWSGVGIGSRDAGGTRSARVIESRAPATASRTRTHRRLTVHRDAAVAQRRVLGVVGGADHRRDGALEGAEDLAHRDRLGRAGELVAAVGAAGADDEAGLAQADDELLQVGPRQVLLGGDLGQRGRARCRNAAPSWTISRTPYSPFVLKAMAPLPWKAGRGSAWASESGQGTCLDIRVISSGLSLRGRLRERQRACGRGRGRRSAACAAQRPARPALAPVPCAGAALVRQFVSP